MTIENTNKIKINSILSQAVHRPSIELSNGKVVPLYARSESYNGNEEDADYIHDQDWISACGKKYSSPNNIRRIAIGNSKIGIQYFRAIDNSSKWVVRGLSENIDEQGGTTAYSGNAFEFARKYAMSNLEELYFDTGVLSALLTSGSTQYPVHDVMEFANSFRINKDTGMQYLKEIMTIELMRGENIGDKQIVEKYNRIRAIGFVSQLDNKIEKWKAEMNGSNDEDEIWGALKAMPSSQVILAGKQLDSKWGMVTVDGVAHAYNENFVLRKGLYRFDDEKLTVYVQAYKNKFYSNNREEKKTPLEIMLDKSDRAENIIKALMITNGKEDVISEINKMTSSGKSKYMDYID